MKYNGYAILVLIVAICACTRTENWSYTLHKCIENHTNCDLYYEVETNMDNKSSYVAKNKDTTLLFYKEDTVNANVLMSTIRQSGIKIIREIVYNLSDTTKYEYGVPYEIIPEPSDIAAEKLFAQSLSYSLGKHSTDKNADVILTLSISDTLLTIMQKDYTMLEKFKEYYE